MRTAYTLTQFDTHRLFHPCNNETPAVLTLRGFGRSSSLMILSWISIGPFQYMTLFTSFVELCQPCWLEQSSLRTWKVDCKSSHMWMADAMLASEVFGEWPHCFLYALLAFICLFSFCVCHIPELLVSYPTSKTMVIFVIWGRAEKGCV